MDLLTIPLSNLRRAVQLAEKRELLVRELEALGRGASAPATRKTNLGVRRYWKQWRKAHGKD